MKKIQKLIWEHINSETEYCCYAKVTLGNGRVLELTSENDFVLDGNSYTHSAGEGFPIGQALCKTITLTIDNSDKRYLEYDFIGATIDLYTEIEYPSDTEPVTFAYDRILEGRFYITDTVDTRGDTISFTAYDAMVKADVPFVLKTNGVYPSLHIELEQTTIGNVLRQVCAYIGIVIDTNSLPYYYDTVKNQTIIYAPDQCTCRDIIGYIAGMTGGNAIITVDGKLTIKMWDLYSIPPVISGNAPKDDVINATGASNSIFAGTFGTTQTEQGIDYYYPSTKVLSDSFDEVTTPADDIMFTAIRFKYHPGITGGTELKTITFGLSELENVSSHIQSDYYNYVATIEGNNNSLAVPLVNTNKQFAYIDSQPYENDDRYIALKSVNAHNHLYRMEIGETRAEELFGNNPVTITFTTYYRGHKVYSTKRYYNQFYSIASQRKILDYNGADIDIYNFNSTSSSAYRIGNQSDMNEIFDNVSPFTLVYQPSYEEHEKHYVLELEFLTDKVYNPSVIVDRILGVPFRPFRGSFIPDTSVEFMDMVYLVTRDNEVYTSFITDLTFNYLGASDFANASTSASDNNSSYSSPQNNAVWEQVKVVNVRTEQQETELEPITSTLRNYTIADGIQVLLPTSFTSDGKVSTYETLYIRNGLLCAD